MLPIAQLKKGVIFHWQGSVYKVLDSAHLKMGRGGGIQQVKMQNLLDGSTISNNFKGNDRLEEADVSTAKVNFLYKDGESAHFMDAENFEQYPVPLKMLGKQVDFLKDGQEASAKMLDGKPIEIELPLKLDFKVTETDPGLKGDRTNPGTKQATIETGASVQVPLFIKTGDTVQLDTRNGAYVKRV